MNQSWIPIFSCILLGGIGLFISICLVLSLIPIYTNNHSVDKSNTIYPVYTVNNLTFTIGGNTGKQIRTIRATPSSPAATTAMITSIQYELNQLCSEVGCYVVVSGLTMSSITYIFVTLKIYFAPGCEACELAQQKLLKQIFKKGQTIEIYLEYYQNCSSYPITSGTTIITLDNDITINQISKPIQTLIASLVQQTDLCGNQAVAFPTDCNSTEASGTVTALFINGTNNYTYYCYYFVPSTSASNIEVQFDFSSDYNNNAILIDDVTLNSTVNLITNGGFETSNLTSGLPGPPWTVSSCGNTCAAFVTNEFQPNTGNNTFLAAGAGIILSQTVAINTVGEQFIYRLGFWLDCIGDPSLPCSVIVTLTTT